MKYVIAGSRTIDMGPEKLKRILEVLQIEIHPGFDVIIGGECPRGPDAAAKAYARWQKIEYAGYPADWDANGKAAGPIRNSLMAKDGDVLILIWDGESRGSTSMKMEMLRRKKPIHEMIIRKHFT